MNTIKLDSIKEKLQNTVEAELEKQLRNIPNIVHRIVNESILTIIGVRRGGSGSGGGGYSVDPFSKTGLNDYIERQVNKKIEEILGPLLDKHLKQLLKSVTLQRSITTETERQATYCFERKFREEVTKKLEKLGTKFGERIGEELDAVLDGVGDHSTEIEDPTSFQGRLGQLFLEEIAETVATK